MCSYLAVKVSAAFEYQPVLSSLKIPYSPLFYWASLSYPALFHSIQSHILCWVGYGVVMPKIAKELTAIEVKRITTPGLHAVGLVAGLLLQVSATGSRSWILRTMIGGKRRDVGLGSFPEVPLALARDKARTIKATIQDGRDPIAERKAARLELTRQQSRLSFRDAAKQCHAIKSAEFRNEKHATQWLAALENHVFPMLGDRPVADIDTDEILQCLLPIWTQKPETASRVRQRIENVFDFAVASKLRESANPARWKGCLQPQLPSAEKLKTKRGTRHHPALPVADMPRFMRMLRLQLGTAARALEFAILTAARPSEVIGSKVDKKPGATWPEIDLGKGLWTIPPRRMKAGRQHCVPLSDEAQALLEALPRQGDAVFPGARGQMSNATMGAVIERMHEKIIRTGGAGFIDPKQGRVVSPHGMRSSFKEWARENSKLFADELSEIALAHVSTDVTRAAYARGELIGERTELMQAWADYLASR